MILVFGSLPYEAQGGMCDLIGRTTTKGKALLLVKEHHLVQGGNYEYHIYNTQTNKTTDVEITNEGVAFSGDWLSEAPLR